jgi:GR25 family glycosyltransferase involved in LPS biosynthesis
MKTYIINLERRPDRREVMAAQLERNSFEDFEFINAVDGQTLQPTEELRRMFSNNNFYSRASAIACALSHLNVWRTFLHDTSLSSYQNVTVFEDDAHLEAHCTPENVEKITHVIPPDTFDVILLGYHTKCRYDGPTDPTRPGFAPMIWGKYLGGTFAYVVSRKGAEKMLAAFESDGFRETIDGCWKTWMRYEFLKVFEIGPPFVRSEFVDGPESRVDSDIQRDVRSLF